MNTDLFHAEETETTEITFFPLLDLRFLLVNSCSKKSEDNTSLGIHPNSCY
jgi:hypothetical protein